MEIISFSWIIILPFSLYSIYKYYNVRKENNLKGIKLYQPLTTILSLFICFLSFLSPSSNVMFSLLITIGMIIALVGDFLNIDMNEMSVVIRGLLIFLVSYLIYTVSAFVIIGFNLWMLIPIISMFILFLVVFSLIFRSIQANMEKVAMGIYGILLTMMAAAGLSSLFSPNVSLVGSILLAIGFLIICLGDYEFALSTFWKDLNFPYGPIFYSGGQLLVALSLFYIV